MDVVKAQAYYDSIGWVSLPCFGVTKVNGELHCNCREGLSCAHKGKHPKVKLTQYVGRLQDIPKAQEGDNLAVLVGPHSGIVDLECDKPEAIKVIEGLFEGEVPETTSFKSFRGTHRIFQFDQDLPAKGSQKAVSMYGGDGLDCLYGNGDKFQYMMVPPSIHPSGSQYQWINPPKIVPPAKLPKSAVTQLCSYNNSTEKVNDDTVNKAFDAIESGQVPELYRIYEEGERHAALLAKAGRHLRYKKNLESQDHKEYLVRWADERTTWDLSDKRVQFEILDIINHVIACEERRRRGIATGLLDKPDDQQEDWDFVWIEDLMQETEEHEYLIDNILVKNEPMVIGAPSKSLKTFSSYDLAASLATGTPFLGKFNVERQCKVAYFSAESGRISSRQMVQSIWKHKTETLGLTGTKWYKHFAMRFKTPKIDSMLDLEMIKRYVGEMGIEVLMIDPLYLSFESVKDASQVYQMGSAFRSFIEVCSAIGVTPILIHHSRKNIGSDYMQLDELTQAGIAEVARQFILLNRREKFDGITHKMNMNCGGSANHFYRGEFEVPAKTWIPKFDTLDSTASAMELLDCKEVLYDVISLNGRLNIRQLFIKMQADRSDGSGNELPPFLAPEILRSLDDLTESGRISYSSGRYSVPCTT